ncbi:MAG: E3 ubiquitin protein ligase [Chlamydiae bacterium]|nr:E3 ubiquitin protein ligase [Chlamydiota bacterium]
MSSSIINDFFCGICQKPLINSEVIIFPCEHKFHEICKKNWWENIRKQIAINADLSQITTICPLCEKTIHISEPRPLIETLHLVLPGYIKTIVGCWQEDIKLTPFDPTDKKWIDELNKAFAGEDMVEETLKPLISYIPIHHPTLLKYKMIIGKDSESLKVLYDITADYLLNNFMTTLITKDEKLSARIAIVQTLESFKQIIEFKSQELQTKWHDLLCNFQTECCIPNSELIGELVKKEEMKKYNFSNLSILQLLHNEQLQSDIFSAFSSKTEQKMGVSINWT